MWSISWWRLRRVDDRSYRLAQAFRQELQQWMPGGETKQMEDVPSGLHGSPRGLSTVSAFGTDPTLTRSLPASLLRVKSCLLSQERRRPLRPDQRTSTEQCGWSASCQQQTCNRALSGHAQSGLRENHLRGSNMLRRSPQRLFRLVMKYWREASGGSATVNQAKAIAVPLASINGALAAMGTTRASLHRQTEMAKRQKS
jgi:hypothetical protein